MYLIKTVIIDDGDLKMLTKMYTEKFAKMKSLKEINDLMNSEKEALKKIEEYNKLFETIEMYHKRTIPLFSKYYIINKKKHNSENIQEYIQSKIRDLNHINALNKYFFQIDRKVVDKEENIHNYNNYNISVVEFEHISLKNVIDETIIHQLYLPPIVLLNLYEDIVRYVKNNKSSCKQVDRDNKNFVYHTIFIEKLRKFINKRLCEIYGCVFRSRMDEIIMQYCSEYKCCQTLNINNIAKHLPKKVLEEVVDILIELDLTDSTLWLCHLNID